MATKAARASRAVRATKAAQPTKAARTTKAAADTAGTAGARRRLNADARRGLILKAARQAFTETGDMSGTTIRAIAEKAGISEGLIYRHFESKDQLYVEAVVEPLREVIDKLVAVTETLEDEGELTAKRQAEVMRDLNDQLVGTLEEILPLLGLVLFGDPKIARRFYRQNFAVAMDRLATAWKSVEGRYGFAVEAPDVSARAVMGMCLIIALELHHNPKFDRARAVALISDGIARGFFPKLNPKQRRR